jgi:hypothetical protein
VDLRARADRRVHDFAGALIQHAMIVCFDTNPHPFTHRFNLFLMQRAMSCR